MSKYFSEEEWKKINHELLENPQKYGFPKRVYGSVVIGSFNIRKLGGVAKRNKETWDFIAKVCAQFDLLAVQEVMDDLSGLKHLLELMGDEYGMIVSDKTGVFPGDQGLGERLAFIFRWSVIKRGEVVSDITYDRSKVTEILFENYDGILEAKKKYDAKLKKFESGSLKKKPKFELPIFFSFIRQPFCVSFKIAGHPGTKPIRFMAINAHLIFGTPSERKKEFQALMEWIINRVQEYEKSYYPNFILLGDLNLDYDDPAKDYKEIAKYLKSFNTNTVDEININFPFLDIHPTRETQYTSNVKMTQRYDQIGMFFKDKGFPTYLDNKVMGENEKGPDFGVFNFTELFSNALYEKSYNELSSEEKETIVCKYEHKVSDHMPIWIRLPLPE